MSALKHKVLIVTPYFFPYEGPIFGGGCKTISNQYHSTIDNYSYDVYTWEYKKFSIDLPKQKNIVYFSSYFSLFFFSLLIKIKNYKKIQFNSFFSPFTFIFLLAFFVKKIDNKILIFPRGELLQINSSFKKRTYIKFIKIYSLFKKINFVATSQIEYESLIKQFGNYQNFSIKYCTDFLDVLKKDYQIENYKIARKNIKLVFISNLNTNKNVRFLIEIMSHLPENYCLDIYGDGSNEEYINQLKDDIQKKCLSSRVTLKGAIEHKYVVNIFSKYNAFVFPTLSENFGYAIYEALQAGCIPIISNTTPWNNIHKKCGLVIDINDEAITWALKTKDLFLKNDNSLISMSNSCKEFAINFYNNSEAKKEFKILINT